MSTYSISGNTSVGLAVVDYTGTANGSVTCDALGNYTITGLNNGTYTLSVAGAVFVVPAQQLVTVSGANITGVDFARANVSGTVDSLGSDGVGYIRINPDTLVFFNTKNWRGGSGFTFAVTSVNVVMGVATYTGTITGGDSNALVGVQLTGFGFENEGNNVAFVVTASTATTLVCAATTQVDETGAVAAATNNLPAVGFNVLFNFGEFSGSAVNISAA
jgi:hypothetical protein